MSKAQLETECSYGLLSTKSSAAPAEAWAGWFDLHGWEAAHVRPEKAQKEDKTLSVHAGAPFRHSIYLPWVRAVPKCV